MVPFRSLSSRLFPDVPAGNAAADTAPLTLEADQNEPVFKIRSPENLEPLPSSFWETAPSLPPSTTRTEPLPAPPSWTAMPPPLPLPAVVEEAVPHFDEDDLGPPAAVSAMAGPANLNGLLPKLETSPLTSLLPVTSAPLVPPTFPSPMPEAPVDSVGVLPSPVMESAPSLPPAAPLAAPGREEFAAVQEMLLDINLAVIRRKSELEELDQKASAARDVIAKAAEAELSLEQCRTEMEEATARARLDRDSLEAILIDLRSEHGALTVQSADLMESIADLQSRENQLKSATEALAHELAADKTERAEVSAALTWLRQEMAEATEARKRQEEEAAVHLETVRNESSLAGDALQRVKDQLSNTQMENELLHRTWTGHKAVVTELEEKLQRLTEETSALEATLEARTAELGKVEAQLEESRRSMALTESGSRAREAEAAARCQAMEAAATLAAAQLEKLEAALAASLARQQEVDQVCQESERQRAAWETEQAALTEKLSGLKVQVEQQSTTLAETRQELTARQSTLQTLQQELSRAESDHASRRAALEAGLEELTANHARAEQALAATRARHEALLVKQDEALTELESRQEKVAALAAREATLAAALDSSGLTPHLAAPVISDEDKAALAELQAQTEALKNALGEKNREQATLEKSLQEAHADLTDLRHTIAREQEAWHLTKEKMQAEAAAAKASIQASRESMLKEQTFQQDLANRHTAALNDLDAVKANVESLQKEAEEIQTTIRQRTTQKENIIKEIRLAREAMAALPEPRHEENGPAAKPFTDAVQEKTVMDLIRLVDATDSAHALICQAAPGGMATSQFTLLRESVTGILKNLGVKEFGVAPGTEVDDNIRRQIQVVKNLNGNATPCIQTVLSSGFVLDPGNGQYTFLRKPEVIVSSEETQLS